MPPYHIFIGVGIVLIVTCLVVRDRTEYRISKLRSEFMALRTEEQRQADLRDEIELMVAQAGEALMRGDRRCQSLLNDTGEMANLMEQMEPLIPGEPSAGSASVEREDQA